jgi:hypothetical protein
LTELDVSYAIERVTCVELDTNNNLVLRSSATANDESSHDRKMNLSHSMILYCETDTAPSGYMLTKLCEITLPPSAQECVQTAIS